MQSYKLLENLECKLKVEFVTGFHEKFDVKKVLVSWCDEDKRCVHRRDGVYYMLVLREPYQSLMGLLWRIYGQKDCMIFRDS